MKKFFIISFVFLSASIYSQTFPEYKKVVSRFFKTYSINDLLEDSLYIRFEKKKDGYHVVTYNYYSERVIEDKIYWNPLLNMYNGLNFSKASGPLTYEAGFLNAGVAYYYNKSPYYGYNQWTDDVIKEFGDNINDLPDSLLQVLGRAYSMKASNLLNNNSGLSDEKERFVLSDGPNCLSEEQLKKYRFYNSKAIEAYKKLKDRKPDYETFVGSVDVQYANEYMVAFLELLVYQNMQEAEKNLPDALYSDYLISSAKNILNSCPKYAILFTNGDVDTYSLLYVQSKLKFRRDVLVANLSLLNTTRYFNFLCDSVFDAAPFPSMINKNDSKKYDNQVFYLLPNVDLKSLNANEIVSNVQEFKGYFSLPTDSFAFNCSDKKIEWGIRKKYLSSSDFFVLNMLAANANKRAVCYSVTCGTENMIDLNKYMSLEAFVYRLSCDSSSDDISVNTNLSYDLLMNVFEYKGFDNASARIETIMYTNKWVFLEISRALNKENQTEKLNALLNKMIELFPNEQLPYDFRMIEVVEMYYGLNQTTIANGIAKTIARNYINNKIQDESEYRDYVVSALQSLLLMVQKQGQLSVVVEIEKAIAKLEK